MEEVKHLFGKELISLEEESALINVWALVFSMTTLVDAKIDTYGQHVHQDPARYRKLAF